MTARFFFGQHTRLYVLLGLLALVGILSAPRFAVSQTATQQFDSCMDAAAVDANNCYVNADGYFSRRACDIRWDINQTACAAALIRSLKL